MIKRQFYSIEHRSRDDASSSSSSSSSDSESEVESDVDSEDNVTCSSPGEFATFNHRFNSLLPYFMV